MESNEIIWDQMKSNQDGLPHFAISRFRSLCLECVDRAAGCLLGDDGFGHYPSNDVAGTVRFRSTLRDSPGVMGCIQSKSLTTHAAEQTLRKSPLLLPLSRDQTVSLSKLCTYTELSPGGYNHLCM